MVCIKGNSVFYIIIIFIIINVIIINISSRTITLDGKGSFKQTELDSVDYVHPLHTTEQIEHPKILHRVGENI